MASNLESAMEKIKDVCPFDDLPAERNDDIWKELYGVCNLTLGELSALKNARCPSQGECRLLFGVRF